MESQQNTRVLGLLAVKHAIADDITSKSISRDWTESNSDWRLHFVTLPLFGKPKASRLLATNTQIDIKMLLNLMTVLGTACHVKATLFPSLCVLCVQLITRAWTANSLATQTQNKRFFHLTSLPKWY